VPVALIGALRQPVAQHLHDLHQHNQRDNGDAITCVS
jgi:hypothetical protein